MKKVLPAIAIAGVLAVAGCGGDDGGGGGDVQAYCRLSQESEGSSGFPTDQELEEFRDAAPPEIRDDVDTLVDAFREVEDPDDPNAALALFEDEEVVEAIENIQAFEAENCEQAGAEE